MSNLPGFFIVFEGLDGSGQTTQAKLLEKFLEKRNKEVLLTKEPTEGDNRTKVAPAIQKILTGEVDASDKKLQSLFIEDRRLHLENQIEPALKEGKIVICDRYEYSTIAYGAAQGVEKEYLEDKQEEFPEPDLTIFLDVPSDVCEERIEARGEERSIFENPGKLEKIENVYADLVKEYNMEVVDGNGDASAEEVARRVQSVAMKELRI